MSEREWKPGDMGGYDETGRLFAPGDVALVRNEYGVWNRAILAVRPGGLVWEYGVTDARAHDYAQSRPLIVIDPEDREQCEDLADALAGVGVSNPGWDLIRTALREFANPTSTKPDEPTGLGAVVAAIFDNQFVRVGNGPAPWWRVGDPPSRGTCAWSDIAVVSVLSEGVIP